DSKVGPGGVIEVESSGEVRGGLYASAGVSSAIGANNVGGEILINGSVNLVSTVSAGTYNGNHGGDIEVGTSGTVGSIDVRGGIGSYSSGNPGSVIVSGNVTGLINVSGADTSFDHAPRSGGEVDLNATAQVGNIDASGGNNLNLSNLSNG